LYAIYSGELLEGLRVIKKARLKLESGFCAQEGMVIAMPVIDPEIKNVIDIYNLPINLLMMDGNSCNYLI
jgi:hypothetical protein